VINEYTVLEDAEAALRFISADCDRETWVRMAMALKSEFGEAGFDVWDFWSQAGDSYKPGDARAAWKSVKAGGAIKIETLFYLAIENGYTPEKKELSVEQKQAHADKLARRRAQRKKEQLLEEKRTAAWHKQIAELADTLRNEYIKREGTSPYLDKKKVRNFGIGFFNQALIIEVNDETQSTRIISGADSISAYYKSLDRENYKEKGIWFLHLKPGVIAVPLKDEHGTLFNIQFIFSGGAKQFIKHGRKSGCFHLIGDEVVVGDDWILQAEGYATAASIHMATGDTVAVAFDAGNMLHVAKALRNKCPTARLLMCGDDDAQTEGNPGKVKAEKAAIENNGMWCVPNFDEAAA